VTRVACAVSATGLRTTAGALPAIVVGELLQIRSGTRYTNSSTAGGIDYAHNTAYSRIVQLTSHDTEYSNIYVNRTLPEYIKICCTIVYSASNF
jgi:hypothetical protein